jgi:hypothetical protein
MSQEDAANPAEQQSPAKPASRSFVIFAGALLALGLAAGGYFVFKWLQKPTTVGESIVPIESRERKTREVPAVTFTDVTSTSGITYHHANGAAGDKLLPETMGGGVAIIDYDRDGKPDILLINGSTWPGHSNPTINTAPPPTLKLYRNLGDMKFEDVTAKVGLNVTMYGMGVAVGDFDNDGFPDIFVSCVGKHHLFRNVNGQRFEDVTDRAGVGGVIDLPNVTKEEFLKWQPPIPLGSSCTFIDYDGDGRLDLFVCHYVTWSPGIDRVVNKSLEGGKRTYVQPGDFEGAQCKLYRNLGDMKFEDVTEKAGILVTEREGIDANSRVRNVGKSLGVVVFDADGDGWPDIFVANDTVRNFFFHNEPGPGGTRVFKETALPIGAAYADGGVPRAGMGIDWGEFAPGRRAVVVANFANEPLTFLEKDQKRLAFSDSTASVGLAAPSRVPLKFGALFFDYDNDGRLDLFLCNGHIEPEVALTQKTQSYAQAPHLYWNTGDPECYFEPVPAARAGNDLFKPLVGRGCAFADLDGDGDLDLVLVSNGGEVRILRNDAPKTNHSVRLDLRGDGTKSNRSAIGAVVTVEAGGQTLTRQVTGARGYLSQSELVLTVGIGTATKADKVTVRWPGKEGGTETWTNLDARTTPHILEQGTAK